MENKQKLTKLQVEIDDAVHRTFKALTVQRGVTMRAAIEEIVKVYGGASPAETGATGRGYL